MLKRVGLKKIENIYWMKFKNHEIWRKCSICGKYYDWRFADYCCKNTH